jgi:hypothetical protein
MPLGCSTRRRTGGSDSSALATTSGSWQASWSRSERTYPYTLEPEPTANPHRIAHRLRMPRGNATRCGSGRRRRTTQSPVCSRRAGLRDGCQTSWPRAIGHAGQGKRLPLHRDAYRLQELDARPRTSSAIWQPRAARAPYVPLVLGAGAEHERSDDADLLVEYRDSFPWSWLNRLAVLHNVDKHRHFNLTAFWPDLLYCGSSEGGHDWMGPKRGRGQRRRGPGVHGGAERDDRTSP